MRTNRIIGGTYYWIVANYQGRLVVIGPKSDESEATRFAYDKLDVPFEVVSLNTRDRAKATSQIKARKLDATADLGGSIEKAMHKSPQEYSRKWWEAGKGEQDGNS